MASILVDVKSRLKGTKFGEYYRRRRWNEQILSYSNARKAVEKNMSHLSDEEKEKMTADILDAAKKYRFSSDEYFYYHFYDKPEEIRKTFISDLNRIDFCETLNKAKNLAIFDDKMRSFETFGKYYGRDAFCVTRKKDIAELIKFVEKHNKFILKPLTGTCGRGIQIVDMNKVENKEAYLKQLFNEYCSGLKDGFIVEELIVQDPELAKFNPASVNTIRLATVCFDEGVEVISSFFRMGRNGSVVDNVGSGGVFGVLDLETGAIVAAADAYGVNYTTHPDTNFELIGFKVPRFEEAKEMAKELAKLIKGNKYAGWDLALTEKGWVMVEGNARGQFVWQIPLQKGYMKETNEILRRLGLPEMINTGIR